VNLRMDHYHTDPIPTPEGVISIEMAVLVIRKYILLFDVNSALLGRLVCACDCLLQGNRELLDWPRFVSGPTKQC